MLCDLGPLPRMCSYRTHTKVQQRSWNFNIPIGGDTTNKQKVGNSQQTTAINICTERTHERKNLGKLFSLWPMPSINHLKIFTTSFSKKKIRKLPKRVVVIFEFLWLTPTRSNSSWSHSLEGESTARRGIWTRIFFDVIKEHNIQFTFSIWSRARAASNQLVLMYKSDSSFSSSIDTSAWGSGTRGSLIGRPISHWFCYTFDLTQKNKLISSLLGHTHFSLSL